MNIQLDPNHKLTSDKHNYIIEKKSIIQKGKNKGEIAWKPILFYPRLQQALQGYSERFLREGDCNSLESLEASIHGLYELIEGVKEVCDG